jgi:hypothetical protein
LWHQYFIDIVGINTTASTLAAPEGLPMGKTLPPFSELIEQERRRWAPFRRALSQPDADAFDSLLAGITRHL